MRIYYSYGHGAGPWKIIAKGQIQRSLCRKVSLNRVLKEGELEGVLDPVGVEEP